MIPLSTWSLAFMLGMTSVSLAMDTLVTLPPKPDVEFVLGWNWNQPVAVDYASSTIGNRLGLNFETPGIGVGKAGHLDVSIGLVYSTRAIALDGTFDRAVFSLVQMPILGHGPIKGLPWLEAAAGVTPGWVLDWILGGPQEDYIALNNNLKLPLNCDITIGLVAHLRYFQIRALLFNSPLGNVRYPELLISGFQLDAHIPLHWKKAR
jgi:hypothetical protein